MNFTKELEENVTNAGWRQGKRINGKRGQIDYENWVEDQGNNEKIEEKKAVTRKRGQREGDEENWRKKVNEM